jgi:hypothetical protein
MHGLGATVELGKGNEPALITNPFVHFHYHYPLSIYPVSCRTTEEWGQTSLLHLFSSALANQLLHAHGQMIHPSDQQVGAGVPVAHRNEELTLQAHVFYNYIGRRHSVRILSIHLLQTTQLSRGMTGHGMQLFHCRQAK